MNTPLSVLIVSNSEDNAASLLHELRSGGYQPESERVSTPESMKTALARRTWDVVLADHITPELSVLDAMLLTREHGSDLPFIIVSSTVDDDTVRAAIRAGAHDYLTRNDLTRLVPAIRRELREMEERRELKRVEKALRESEQRYRRVAQMVPDIIFTIDQNGRFTFINDAIRSLGYEPEELLGEHFSKIMQPGDVEAASRSKVLPKYTGREVSGKEAPKLFDERRVGNRKTTGLEVTLLAKDTGGGRRPDQAKTVRREKVIEVTTSGLYDTDADTNERKFLGTIGVIRDITQRKRAEAALRESEGRYRSLTNDVLDSAKVGVFILDRQLHVVWMNRALERYFGLKRDDVIGKDSRTLIKSKIHRILEEGEKYKNILLKTYEDNASVENLICHVLPGSRREERWLEYWSQPIDSGLYKGGRVEYYTDITGIKRTEGLLLQSEKLKAMGEMASGIAHDFNNVLAIILGNVQLLELRYEDHTEMVEGLGIIRKAANDGIETIRRMSEFTRIERDSARFSPVDMSELVKQAINFSRPRWKEMAQAGGVTYDISLDGLRQVPLLQGNPAELREVLINIINNALDAMPGGGRLSLRTWREGGSVCVSVTDTGIGMSKDVQMRLFDPFFTTKGTEGSGLGMSVTYGIIKRHGGNIYVESKKGRGSTITLKLPTTKKTTAAQGVPGTIHKTTGGKHRAGEAAHPQSHPGLTRKKVSKGRRILVVDDEEEICKLLRKFLSSEGYNVKSVNKGDDAIKLLKRENFDLVLCDLAMPEVSGWDIIHVIEGLDRRPGVGLITGWGAMLEARKTDDLGVDFILSKPIELFELLKLVEDTLGVRHKT